MSHTPPPLPPIPQESHEAVVFRLLDEVIAAELVTTTIRSKVIPYIDRHQMQLDSVLLNYIKVSSSHATCTVSTCSVVSYILAHSIMQLLVLSTHSSSCLSLHGTLPASLTLHLSLKPFPSYKP